MFSEEGVESGGTHQVWTQHLDINSHVKKKRWNVIAAYFLMGYREDVNQVERALLLRSEHKNILLIGVLNTLLERKQDIKVGRMT